MNHTNHTLADSYAVKIEPELQAQPYTSPLTNNIGPSLATDSSSPPHWTSSPRLDISPKVYASALAVDPPQMSLEHALTLSHGSPLEDSSKVDSHKDLQIEAGQMLRTPFWNKPARVTKARRVKKTPFVSPSDQKRLEKLDDIFLNLSAEKARIRRDIQENQTRKRALAERRIEEIVRNHWKTFDEEMVEYEAARREEMWRHKYALMCEAFDCEPTADVLHQCPKCGPCQEGSLGLPDV